MGGGDSPAPAREVVKPLLASELGVWDIVAVPHSKFQQAQEGRRSRNSSGGDVPDLPHSIPILGISRKLPPRH